MNQAEIEEFIAGLENVRRSENYGYTFFFVGDEQMMPFVTLANQDQEFDKVSNLSREGVFRINIGVGRGAFESLVGSASSEDVDFTAVDTFLPHPEYAKQHWVCILSPSGERMEMTKQLIREAHQGAVRRAQRKAPG